MAISVNQLFISQSRDVLLEACKHKGYLYLSEEKGVLKVSLIPKPQGLLARLWLYIWRLFDRGFNLNRSLVKLGESFKALVLESSPLLLGDMYVNLLLARILAEDVNKARSRRFIDLAFLDQARGHLFVALHARQTEPVLGGMASLILSAKMRALAVLFQKQLQHYHKSDKYFAAIIERCSREEISYQNIRSQFLGILQQVKTVDLRPIQSLVDRVAFDPLLRGLIDRSRAYRRAARVKELPNSPQKTSRLISIVGELLTETPDYDINEVIDILDHLPTADTHNIHLCVVRRLVLMGEKQKALAQITKITQPGDPFHDQALEFVCQELNRGSMAEALTFIEEKMKADGDKRFSLLFFAPYINTLEWRGRLQRLANTLSDEVMRRVLIDDLDHIWAAQFK